jgi:hypothetical protein
VIVRYFSLTQCYRWPPAVGAKRPRPENDGEPAESRLTETSSRRYEASSLHLAWGQLHLVSFDRAASWLVPGQPWSCADGTQPDKQHLRTPVTHDEPWQIVRIGAQGIDEGFAR